MSETTSERMLRLFEERYEAIESMGHDAGTWPAVAEDYHAMELALIASARRGVWSSAVLNYGEELIEIEDERIKSWQ